jgi:hypothetical protein
MNTLCGGAQHQGCWQRWYIVFGANLTVVAVSDWRRRILPALLLAAGLPVASIAAVCVPAMGAGQACSMLAWRRCYVGGVVMVVCCRVPTTSGMCGAAMRAARCAVPLQCHICHDREWCTHIVLVTWQGIRCMKLHCLRGTSNLLPNLYHSLHACARSAPSRQPEQAHASQLQLSGRVTLCIRCGRRAPRHVAGE